MRKQQQRCKKLLTAEYLAETRSGRETVFPAAFYVCGLHFNSQEIGFNRRFLFKESIHKLSLIEADIHCSGTIIRDAFFDGRHFRIRRNRLIGAILLNTIHGQSGLDMQFNIRDQRAQRVSITPEHRTIISARCIPRRYDGVDFTSFRSQILICICLHFSGGGSYIREAQQIDSPNIAADTTFILVITIHANRRRLILSLRHRTPRTSVRLRGCGRGSLCGHFRRRSDCCFCCSLRSNLGRGIGGSFRGYLCTLVCLFGCCLFGARVHSRRNTCKRSVCRFCRCCKRSHRMHIDLSSTVPISPGNSDFSDGGCGGRGG